MAFPPLGSGASLKCSFPDFLVDTDEEAAVDVALVTLGAADGLFDASWLLSFCFELSSDPLVKSVSASTSELSSSTETKGFSNCN